MDQRRPSGALQRPSSGLRQPARLADEGLVTIFARLLTSPAPVRLAPARGRTLAAVFAASLAAALLLIATPARAAVAEVLAGTKVGLQPRNGTTLGTVGAEPETFENESGNVVLHGTSEYAIYWDPKDQFHHEWLVHLDGFFQSLGKANLGTPFAPSASTAIAATRSARSRRSSRAPTRIPSNSRPRSAKTSTPWWSERSHASRTYSCANSCSHSSQPTICPRAWAPSTSC